MSIMLDYFDDNQHNVRACDNYITDGNNIIVAKHFINSKFLKFFKTTDIDICKNSYIPYEKGEPYELSEHVMLKENMTMAFKVNDEYCFDYKYINLFLSQVLHKSCIKFYYTKSKALNAPILKVFYYDDFAGLIVASKINEDEKSIEQYVKEFMEEWNNATIR